MIGKRELERTIKRAMLGRESEDAAALARLGYNPEAVEAIGHDFADTRTVQRIDRRDAIAAAFAAGLEVGVRVEREQRGA